MFITKVSNPLSPSLPLSLSPFCVHKFVCTNTNLCAKDNYLVPTLPRSRNLLRPLLPSCPPPLLPSTTTSSCLSSSILTPRYTPRYTRACAHHGCTQMITRMSVSQSTRVSVSQCSRDTDARVRCVPARVWCVPAQAPTVQARLCPKCCTGATNSVPLSYTQYQ